MHKKILTIITAMLLLEGLAIFAMFSSFRLYRSSDPAAISLPKTLAEITVAKQPVKITLAAGEETLALAPQEIFTGQTVSNAGLGAALIAAAKKFNRPPQNAELVIENNVATTFVPDLPGQDVNVLAAFRLAREIFASASSDEIKIELDLLTTPPERTLAEINSLGIETRIVRGVSDFSGSSGSRITNIRVGASRYNGVLIAPGEEFAFNKHLGPIDGAHGYLPELVIKPEGTVPEFGGGLCQVSTTAFRAAFFAGLPITARRNHAYAVKYYEWIADDKPRAPGLDATIYPGASDLKFINDTPGAILIATHISGKRLYFDFYGTDDKREIAVDGPHPFDRRASGAVKSKVTRTVTKNGETTEVTFNSNYVSPDKYPRVTEYPKPVEPAPALSPDNPNTPNPPNPT